MLLYLLYPPKTRHTFIDSFVLYFLSIQYILIVTQSSTTRLERAYSKPRLSVKTIKDAMKAKLYFAPPGIDPKTYTYAIMKMMDHTRKRIYRAQRKSLNFIKWGKPILVGPREGNSLDARKEKKKNNLGVASTSTYIPLGTCIGAILIMTIPFNFFFLFFLFIFFCGNS